MISGISANDLNPWPEGRRAADVTGISDEYGAAEVCGSPGEFLDKSCLANAGFASHQDYACFASEHGRKRPS
jgi:hypothetical protein